MSVRSQQSGRSNDPFADPVNWKENNPYKPSLTGSVSSRQPARSISTRHSSKHGRPSLQHHSRSHSSPSFPRPLEQIRAETKAANRPRHLKKSSIPAPDTIDRLGSVLDMPYHHDGPYEATLLARQIPGYAPVDAVKESNAKAIAATPRANLIDSLEKHYPLQGTAVVPPGFGSMGEYEEYDIQRMDGKYKRWDHIKYLDEDLKGKGEPSYTIEEFEKQQKVARRAHRNGNGRSNAYEMHTRRDHKDGSTLSVAPVPRQRSGGGSTAQEYTFSNDGGLGRSASSAGRMEGLSRLKKRIVALGKSS